MRVKLFWTEGSLHNFGPMTKSAGGNVADLERVNNDWLEAEPDVNVVHVQQSACGGSLHPGNWLISVWYRVGADIMPTAHGDACS